MLPAVAGPLGLVVLALVDSTSMGTLVIPLILLVVGEGGARRVSSRTLLYLLIIGVFYLLLGIALLAGLLPLMDRLGHLLATPQVMLVLALAGAALVWSFRRPPRSGSAAATRRPPPGAGPPAPAPPPAGPPPWSPSPSARD